MSTDEERAARLASLEDQIRDAENRLKTIKSGTIVAKYVANIKERYTRGDIHCSNERHFVQVPFVAGGPRNQLGCKQRPMQWIFDEMAPYTKATCDCERAALRWKQGHQAPGTTCDQWVGLGCDQKGIGEHKAGMPARKVWPVRYSMNSDELKALAVRFPNWHIECSTTTRGHDHPVAHTSTALYTNALMHDVLPAKRGGTPLAILDVNGNPTSNEHTEAHNPHLHITTACKVITPRDELRRATKWGPMVDLDGRRRWHDLYDREIGAPGSSISPAQMAMFQAIIMIHVMYYYSAVELARLLAKADDDCVLYALVHRFDSSKTSGTINEGEQLWNARMVGGRRWITQHNKLAPSEKYEHVDPEWLFNDNVWTDGNVGLTWETTLWGKDTYLVKMKKYSPPARPMLERNCHTCGATGMFLDLLADPVTETANKPHITHVPRFEPTSDKYIERWESTVVKLDGRYVEYKLPKAVHGLLNEARARMIGRPRTAKEFASHSSLMKTKIKRQDAESNKPLAYEVVEDLLRASFWMDADKTLCDDQELFAAHWKTSRKAEDLYTLGHHGAERKTFGIAVDALVASGAGSNSLRGLAAVAKAVVATRS